MTLRSRTWLAASALAIGIPSAAAAAQPFALEDVDFTPDCGSNGAFDRLLALLFGLPIERHDPVPDESVYQAVSGTALHVLHLAREAPWHGLRLVGIRAYNGIESGPHNVSLVFADDPERVRAVWNARGWSLPPAGERRVIEDEIVTTAIGIESDGSLTAVTCFVD